MESTFENIGWTIGNHCNAKCGHCYSWKVRKDSNEFLTIKDVDRIISQLVRLGVKTVNLGGNEPVYTHGSNIHNSILHIIIQKLSDANIPVGLTTNGISFTWLDKYHHDTLLLINDIDFSLDSPFENEHNENRKAPLFKLVVKSIQRSLSVGIDCSIITCGMKNNFTEEYLSAYLALTNILGCEFRVNTLKPIEPSLVSEMPTISQFYKGFGYLMNNSKCITLGESCITAFTMAGSKGCPCGTSSFRINAKTQDGKVSINPCVYTHEYKIGDLLKEDIFQITSSLHFKSFAKRRDEIPSACRKEDCEYLDSCRGGCTARSYFTYGNLTSKDPYCPSEYQREIKGKRLGLPMKPHIGCDHGLRVHDNYLCTWIGKVNKDFKDTQFTSIKDFYIKKSKKNHISGHEQVIKSYVSLKPKRSK